MARLAADFSRYPQKLQNDAADVADFPQLLQNEMLFDTSRIAGGETAISGSLCLLSEAGTVPDKIKFGISVFRLVNVSGERES